MRFGCSFGIFLNSAHLICRCTDISKCFSGPFDFEITRVDCIVNYLKYTPMCTSIHSIFSFYFYSIPFFLFFYLSFFLYKYFSCRKLKELGVIRSILGPIFLIFKYIRHYCYFSFFISVELQCLEHLWDHEYFVICSARLRPMDSVFKKKASPIGE